jgi:hypothetical protein
LTLFDSGLWHFLSAALWWAFDRIYENMQTSANRLMALWPWMALFAVVSALDLLLTWMLLKEGAAVEANPLAAKILARFGWWGLGLFKASGVAVVLALGFVISRKSRPATRHLLQFASCILVLVVAYSSCLLAQVEVASNRVLTKQHERRAVIGRKHKNAQMYFAKLDQLADELVVGKVTLPVAARELARYLAEVQHDPLPYLRTVAQGFNLEPILAIHLVHHAGFHLLEAPESARILLAGWQSEFASAFYCPLPEFALRYFPKEGEFPEPAGIRNGKTFQNLPTWARQGGSSL